jgi:transcription-repair coupling factor (superfamily II helicase)
MRAFNHEVAAKLREIVQLLRTIQASPFRVNAWLHAVDTLTTWEVTSQSSCGRRVSRA